jgi:MAGUK p55 subfamily protein 5
MNIWKAYCVISVSALDLAQNSNVQDAFVIAVEQQARERLERLSALKRIKPVDMTKLSQQVSPVHPPENTPHC